MTKDSKNQISPWLTLAAYDQKFQSLHLATAERNSLLYNSPQNLAHHGIPISSGKHLPTLDETMVAPTVHFESTSRSHLHEPEGSFSINENLKQAGEIDFSRKLYEYLNAPITKYWFNVFVYTIFLMCFSYVILLETSRNYIWATEWFVIVYITTFSIESLRSLVVSTPRGILAKVKNWNSNFWNAIETIAIIIFYIGLCFRCTGIFKEGINPEFEGKDINSEVYQAIYQSIGYGRALYCVDVVLWFIKLFKFCCVHKTLGPYVTMAGKMMVDMTSFIVILVVVLVSFGICRQSMIYNRIVEWDWSILWNITHEPYFMLYGEVYAPLIDPCSPENKDLMCNPGAWIVPVMMTIYLLVANILLLNLLIAVFNNTFARTKQESNQIWACQRYEVIMQYEAHPILPPPFILLCHLKLLLDMCKDMCARVVSSSPTLAKQFFCGMLLAFKGRKKKARFRADRGLKLFLNENEEENLHDWEEDLVDDYYRSKRREDGKKFEEQMKASAEKILKIERHMNEVEMRDNQMRTTVFDMSARFSHIEQMALPYLVMQNGNGTLNPTSDSNAEANDNLTTEGMS